MNKTAIKNFAIWARNKLIADITYKAGLLGISETEIKGPLPQSTMDVQFFDIGTKEPYSISGIEIKQREALSTVIRNKEHQSDYQTAYKTVIEEVAYTWFNRLIAVRFMEVNDYLPSHIRVLSSESAGKDEPDLVTNPFDTYLEFTPYEKDHIMQLKQDNQLDELFRMLFIKQCNALNAILPNLFEKTSDYTELLLNVAFTDKDGVVYHLVNDIKENDFKIRTEADEEAIQRGDLTEENAPSGQVEIIGWLYQYYNTEPKDETFALLKKNVKITKERIPAATQLFTPDWIVRYMVENSLGRLWLEGHPNDSLKSEFKYYLDEAEQEEEVKKQLDAIREEYKTIKPEDIKVIDPCMGSGHILAYAFDVLIQIYESYGYSQRDAAKNIIENNIYGLDIDNRAYQLAYFAVMMKARQYNRRILNGETHPHVYAIQDSNSINCDQLQYFGTGMDEMQRNIAMLQIEGLLGTFIDAKEYGSILNVDNYDWQLLRQFVDKFEVDGQLSFYTVGVEDTQEQLQLLVEIGAIIAQHYDVVVTNPPYMGISNGNGKLNEFVKKYYSASKADLFAVFIEKCGWMTKKNYFCAMITQHSWMFLSSFEKLREILQSDDIINMAHLGARAFEEIGGEVVQTTSWVLRKSNITNYLATYARLVNYSSQQEKENAFLSKNELYIAQKDNFSKIPRMPIAYWVSDNVISDFEYNEKVENVSETRIGMATANNDLFMRLWYEISYKLLELDSSSREFAKKSCKKWFPYCKGGAFRKWSGNMEYVVNWENDGFDIQNFRDEKSGRIRSHNYNLNYIFKPGLTYTAISSSKFACRYMSKSLFGSGGSGICSISNESIFPLLAFLNSNTAEYLLNALSSTMNFEVNIVGSLPFITGDKKKSLSDIVIDCIKISDTDWDYFETSWNFVKHPFLEFRSIDDTTEMRTYYLDEKGHMVDIHTTIGKGSIENAFIKWFAFTENQFNKLKANEEELNRIFIDIYGLKDELAPEVADKDVTIRKADLDRDIRSFLSYTVGCMFGRYSLDMDGLAYAGGAWDGSKYSTFIPDTDNIIPITDEEYFEDDIVGLFVAFVKKVYGAERLEENLDFIAKALGNKGDTPREIIRNYFLKDFFKDHCKVYQKRPIYWLFDSGKADGFKALIYMHRYDENTIGNLRIDYLHKMQRVYEREIARMQETIDNSTNAREVAAAEKRKDKLIKQLKETKDYDEKIAHLALARIAIDLDDGVKVNYEKVQTGIDGKKLDVLAKI